MAGNDNKLVTLADLGAAYTALSATATTSANGMMSSTDKTKLDGVETGAQVNSVTGVKGNAEGSNAWRTGNVNITAANVGALSTTGGTLTDNLGIKKSGGGGLYIYEDGQSTYFAAAQGFIDNSNNKRVQFQQRASYTSGSDGLEKYLLPAPTAISTPVDYQIATAKHLLNITDANDLSLAGSTYVQANQCSNLPTSSSGTYYQLECMGTCQMAFRFSTAGVDAVFARYYTNNQWYPWVRIDGLYGDEWQELSNDVRGLTVTVKINKMTPRLAKIRIRGTTSEKFTTSNAYQNLYQTTALSSRLADNYVSYGLFNGGYGGQIAISTDGTIKLGYTYKLSDGTAIDIPSGSTIYWEQTIILK